MSGEEKAKFRRQLGVQTDRLVVLVERLAASCSIGDCDDIIIDAARVADQAAEIRRAAEDFFLVSGEGVPFSVGKA